MAVPNVPDDLCSFLTSGCVLFHDEAQCTPKGVALQPLEKLAVRPLTVRIKENSDLADEAPHAGERGYYLVPAVSLIGSCTNYRPAGLLVRLPDQESYGTWYGDHHVLGVFPGASWSQIAANPVPFLNSLWSRKTREAIGAQQLRLWESCEFEER
jgi:hypothetical protein